MGIHVVTQGECLSLIAKKHGFASWRSIYDHDRNADFRAKRPNPNVLYPGDEIYIPDRTRRSESAATGETHTFALAASGARLVIKIAEYTATPLDGWPYTLAIGGATFTGSIPATGVIEHEVPVGQGTGELKVHFQGGGGDAAYRWQLRVGHLDPVDTVSGLQARLANLGFYTGPPASEMNPTLRTAVRQFQRVHGLVVDEIPGPRTQAALVAVYGC